MKWKDGKKARVVKESGFLLFPKTINGETRWLERATWIERATLWGPRNRSDRNYYRWEPIGWEGEEGVEQYYESAKNELVTTGYV